MKHEDGKPNSQADKSSRIVPLTVLLVVACGFSFYLGGIFCFEKNRSEQIRDVTAKSVSSPKESAVFPLQIKSVSFLECCSEYQDYTPCIDPKRWKKCGVHRLTLMERHCPPTFNGKECLIPSLDEYKPTIRWPKSRDDIGTVSGMCLMIGLTSRSRIKICCGNKGRSFFFLVGVPCSLEGGQ